MPPAFVPAGPTACCHHLCRQWWPKHLKASLRLHRLSGRRGGCHSPPHLPRGAGSVPFPREPAPLHPGRVALARRALSSSQPRLAGQRGGHHNPALGLKVILDDCLPRSWWAERRGVGLGAPAGPSFPFPLCLKGVKPEPLLLGRVLGRPRPRSVVREKGPVWRGPRVTCRAAYGSDTHGPRPSAPLLRTSL